MTRIKIKDSGKVINKNCISRGSLFFDFLVLLSAGLDILLEPRNVVRKN